MKVMITGGCGFIGSAAIEKLLFEESVELVLNIDALTYAGNPDNVKNFHNHPKYKFRHTSIGSPDVVNLIDEFDIDSIINFAAETHVDNSISSMSPFISTNVVQTQAFFDSVRKSHNFQKIKLIHISTDEVYGHLGPDGESFRESDILNPRNPYSASKACSEMILNSYVNTYGLYGCVTRCSNNYGFRQHQEKLIPKFTKMAMIGEPLPLYGSGEQIRDWIHVKDHVDGIFQLLLGMWKSDISPGEVFNIGGSNEIRNIDIAKFILNVVDNPESRILHVEDRLGHDFRYSINFKKINNVLGWAPKVGWEEGITETIRYFMNR